MRSLSLLARFALVGTACVVLIAVALITSSRQAIERRALDQAAQTAQLVGNVVIRPLVSAESLAAGLTNEQIERLDRALATALHGLPVTRVKMFGPDGTIVYSDARDLIGERFSTGPLLRGALTGRVGSKLEIPEDAEHAHERGLGALLEVYVPVRYYKDGPVRGAFELYLPYEPIASAVAADVRRQSLLLIGGLALLYLLLFRTVASASQRLLAQSHHNRWLAHHDVLTGLPNRALFAERMSQAVHVARRQGQAVAVLQVDLDRFNEVNDTLGHRIGDLLLREVGARLAGELRDVDTVARLGGDEFAVLLPGVSGTEAACEVARRLTKSLELPLEVDGVTLEVGASVGVACYPEHADDEASLLQRADIALQAAKQEHRVVAQYQPELDERTPARLALFGQLRHAIEDGELVLHYQPKTDLASGQVRGVEALVRWSHPTRGLLAPVEFIDVAEQTGLMRPLTEWVLEEALRQCRQWRDEGLELTVAVNLSARTLIDTELPARVQRCLERYGLPASALELEITESSAMIDPARALEVLQRVHVMGVGLAVDDYGTGHASLAYLRRLPLACLKIDKSFVIGMESNTGNSVIVRSTIELARSLGLRVVAEGVENAEVLRRLTELGCDAAQGYYLGKPMQPGEVPGAVAVLEHRLAGTTELTAAAG